MITSPGPTDRGDDDESFSPMWLFLLEAGTALALFIFILWWTLPKKDSARLPEAEPEKKDDHGQP